MGNMSTSTTTTKQQKSGGSMEYLSGFTVGPDPQPVYSLPIHTIWTGITGKGKSTHGAGVLSRFPKRTRILVFVTKRGEEMLMDGVVPYRNVKPYLVAKHNYEYIIDLLSSMKNKDQSRLEAIAIKCSEGTRSLAEVHERAKRLLVNDESGFVRIFEKYMRDLLQMMNRYQFSKELEIKPGFNRMDISIFPLWLRQMIVASVISKVMAPKMDGGMTDVIVYVPDASKIFPHREVGKSPANAPAELMVSDGRAVNNLLFLDTQAFTRIYVPLLKNMDVVHMTRQQEINEVLKVMANMSMVSKKDLNAGDVQELEKGQFISIISGKPVKQFGMPAWMNNNVNAAIECARNPLRVYSIKEDLGITTTPTDVDEKDYLRREKTLKEAIHKNRTGNNAITTEPVTVEGPSKVEETVAAPTTTPPVEATPPPLEITETESTAYEELEEEEEEEETADDSTAIIDGDDMATTPTDKTMVPITVGVTQHKAMSVRVLQVDPIEFDELSPEGQIVLHILDPGFSNEKNTAPQWRDLLNVDSPVRFDLDTVRATLNKLAGPPYHVISIYRKSDGTTLYKANPQVLHMLKAKPVPVRRKK